jgi:hypothetical protein
MTHSRYDTLINITIVPSNPAFTPCAAIVTLHRSRDNNPSVLSEGKLRRHVDGFNWLLNPDIPEQSSNILAGRHLEVVRPDSLDVSFLHVIPRDATVIASFPADPHQSI